MVSSILKRWIKFSAINKAALICGVPVPEKGDRNDTFSVLNWNIFKQNRTSFLGDMRTLVQCLNPDFMVFQEALLTPPLIAMLEKELFLSWASSPNIYARNHKTHSGVLTASKYKPHSERALISASTEPFLNTPKSMLFSTYKLWPSGPVLLVVNVHALNFKLGLEDYKKQLKQVFTIVAQHGGPIIVSGDFNSWSRKRTDSLLGLARDAGMSRVEFENMRFGRFPISGKAIDHIFYSGASLAPLEGSARCLDHIQSSDHFPMVVKFGVFPGTQRRGEGRRGERER
ncbi:endonuclease/exonuclease/phosphatase family protein [Chitinispirillales bacterium ANBcel5]|uniref:endonuclease/exonuclease/phosphatase family protein n=1 Tax=Cellulosispirillum alkaliphilum TaxID=3039283 RepID=UPI002A51E019|nr:endonuclease/exonuclease/phosphatase family protein [Chitinispirillales bacterium ANBcel5]